MASQHLIHQTVDVTILASLYPLRVSGIDHDQSTFKVDTLDKCRHSHSVGLIAA
jgi:hypothetical protein